MDQNIKGYYSGTSGLLLPVPNKLHYPEEFRERTRLHFYGSLMNSIEINSSFYKIPMASTVKKWVADVPENFRFTFKLFKGITHAPHLGFDPGTVQRFMEAIAPATAKKGCILVQFPPGVKIGNLPQLSRLIMDLRKYNLGYGWKIALEFRNPSLYYEQIISLFEENSLGMVIHDKGTAATPLTSLECNFYYLRFHGPGGNYRGSYDDDVLSEYADYITEWLSGGKTVYVYFNNTMGDAYGNLQSLRSLVSKRI